MPKNFLARPPEMAEGGLRFDLVEHEDDGDAEATDGRPSNFRAARPERLFRGVLYSDGADLPEPPRLLDGYGKAEAIHVFPIASTCSAVTVLRGLSHQ